MLTAKFAFAVPPTAVGDHRGDARIRSGRIHGDRAAEARADHPDAIGIDRRVAGEEIERVAEIIDLFETDDPAELALAPAAAAHVEAERDIAEFVQHPGRLPHTLGVAVGAEAMQHDEGGTLFP